MKDVKSKTKKTKKSSKGSIKEFGLLISVPLALIAIVASIIYVPRMFASPEYSFIYSSCADYSCTSNYIVTSSGAVEDNDRNVGEFRYGQDKASLYYYDVMTDSTRKISLEEASSIKVNSSSKSPDGYRLKRNNNGGGIFFGSSDSAWFLEDGLKKKQIDLEFSGSKYYYSNTINFIGWVE